MRWAAALQSGSEHPLARAVLEAVRGQVLPAIHGLRAVPGRGVTAELPDAGLSLHLGSARYGNDHANTCASQIPASTLLDAGYRWHQGKMELTLAGSNLTGAKSYSQAFSCVTGSLYPDPGRALKAAVRWKF